LYRVERSVRTDEVKVIMRPPEVFAEVPAAVQVQIMGLLHGPWRTATRLIMIVLSTQGMTAPDIADLLGYHPGTVRRWLNRFTIEGVPGMDDRPRCGRPRLGGPGLLRKITALLAAPGPWTIQQIWRHLGRPKISPRTLWRRVRTLAAWRRPRLVAKGDTAHNRIIARIRQRIRRLPAGSVVITEDEAHLDLLPTVRATWILRGQRSAVMTPGKNDRATIFGALDLLTGNWFYLFARRSGAGFIAVLDMLLAAYPTAAAVAVICDNDRIHHAKKVTTWLDTHRRLRLIYGAAYSPHDNPVERIWAAMKGYLALMSLDPTRTGRKRWTNRWKKALNAFEMTFEGRLMPQTRLQTQ
jgi:transposase